MNTIFAMVFILYGLCFPNVANPEFHGESTIGYELQRDWAFSTVELQYHFDLWKFQNFIYGGVEAYVLMNGIKPSEMIRASFPIGMETSYNWAFIRYEHKCDHAFHSSRAELGHTEYSVDYSYTKIMIGVKW